MTDTVGDSRPSRRFDAVVARRLFDGLSSHLRVAGSHNHNLMIVGGAALALLWDDRLTRDVDVLEHRFRWRHDSPAGRHTGAVDFISMRIPAEINSAARLVAEAENLPWNWLNGTAAIFTPECDLEPQVLYRSDCLVVSAPSRRVMLAMKLHAGREVDLEDAGGGGAGPEVFTTLGYSGRNLAGVSHWEGRTRVWRVFRTGEVGPEFGGCFTLGRSEGARWWGVPLHRRLGALWGLVR